MRYLHAAIGLFVAMQSASLIADVEIKGFATLAAEKMVSSDGTLKVEDDEIDFEEGSLLALQVSSQVNDKAKVVAQIMARGEDAWEPTFEWAYLSYDVNPNFKVLAGKQRVPYFAYSDYLDVSFAYHWLEPPEVFYLTSSDSVSGLGVVYTHRLGIFDSRLHAVLGNSSSETDIGGGQMADVKADNLYSFAWSLGYDSLNVRAAYTVSDIRLGVTAVNELAQGWEQAGFPQFGSQIRIDDKDNEAEFLNLGVTYDNGQYLFAAEYSELGIEGSFVSDDIKQYYVSGGYYFGPVLLHATYGETDRKAPSTDFLDIVPRGFGLEPLIFGTQGLFATSELEQDFQVLGVKWDFAPLLALKLDVNRLTDKITDDDQTLVRLGITTVF